MDYLFDTTAALTENAVHGRWAIRESGDDEGREQVPSQQLHAFALSEARLETVPNYAPFRSDTAGDRHYIFAQLAPKGARYSMLGTDRTITDIILAISDVFEGKPEGCKLTGGVSYTTRGRWWRTHITPDQLTFSLSVSAQRFARLRGMVDDLPRCATFNVGDVAGFYSDGSPDRIKVLTPKIRHHPVKIPDGCSIEPPRLGSVGHYELHVDRAAWT